MRRGPYRFLRHPNYVAVATEMLCVPLAHGAWICAALFSTLNAALLRVRVRAEERALGSDWERAFAGPAPSARPPVACRLPPPVRRLSSS